MNLLLSHETERESERVVVRGACAAHIRKVIGAVQGQALRIGVPQQAVGTAEVLEVHPDRVVLGKLELQLLADPPPRRLILALPRPKALVRILQTAASFGIAHIDLVNTWRVDKAYWGSPRLQESAIHEQLWLGCEQGRAAWLPTHATHRLLMPFLQSFESERRSCLLAHPSGETWMSDLAPGCDALLSLVSQTVITSVPRACPSSRYRKGAGTSARGGSRSVGSPLQPRGVAPPRGGRPRSTSPPAP